jgi:hypothetical protein
VAEVPWELMPTVTAILRSIDPRLSKSEREQAAAEALDREVFAFGMLVSVIEDYHSRAERVAGLSEGTMVDRLRAKLVGDSEDIPLGLALAVETPLPPGESPVGARTDAGPTEGAPEAPTASTGLSGRHPTDERLALEGEDLANRIERMRQRFEREDPEAVAMLGGVKQLAALAARLDATRRAEQSAAELDPEAPEACGAHTTQGPCGLRAGHPVGIGLPGEQGHIGGMA